MTIPLTHWNIEEKSQVFKNGLGFEHIGPDISE